MKNLFFSLAILSIYLTTQSFSCKKESVAVSNTVIDITVEDGNSWSAANTVLSMASGATIHLYATQTDIANNTPKYTLNTNASGVVHIPVDFQPNYLLIVNKGQASNLYKGYLIKGIFQTQADIQASAYQMPMGTVGGLQFYDLNGDGIINASDKTTSQFISTIENGHVAITSVIYQ